MPRRRVMAVCGADVRAQAPTAARQFLKPVLIVQFKSRHLVRRVAVASRLVV